MIFTAYDNIGASYRWRISKGNRYTNVGLPGCKIRHFYGYSVFSPDGIERVFEGSWQSVIAELAVVLSNYGMTSALVKTRPVCTPRTEGEE